MAKPDKLQLLKTLHLFHRIPEVQLKKLSDFLSSHEYGDGDLVFQEGTPGDSLYFVSSGHVRIAKRLEPGKPDAGHKELAILGPGHCFGEMALIEAEKRSADAFASGPTVLFRLGQAELARWLQSDPSLAMAFFAELVKTLSGRLRRSSTELTLLFDLSKRLLEPAATAPEMLRKSVEQIVAHLEGEWSAGAFLYNELNAENDFVAGFGGFSKIQERYRGLVSPSKSAWLDDNAFLVVFPGKQRALGHVLFHRAEAPAGEERDEVGRTLSTMGHLIASSLENIGYRTEELLRSRLKASIEASEW